METTWKWCCIGCMAMLCLVISAVFLRGAYETPREAKDRFIQLHRKVDWYTQETQNARTEVASYTPRYGETARDRSWLQHMKDRGNNAQRVVDAIMVAVQAGDTWWQLFNAIPTPGTDIDQVWKERGAAYDKAEDLRERALTLAYEFDD